MDTSRLYPPRATDRGPPPGRTALPLRRRRGGFTLIELVVVMVLFGVMAGVASQNYSQYRDRSVSRRAADVVGGYIALARSHALQRRMPVTLAIDPAQKSLMIRTGTDTIRTLSLGEESDIPLGELTSTFDGDSLTFNGRGLCSVCGIAGKTITVSARGTSYELSVVALGRWKSTLNN